MTTLREAAEQARTALNWAADHIPPQGDPCQCPVCLALDALEKALKEDAIQVKPTKIMGPNLEEVLNSAGFYRRTSLGVSAIMDLMDKVPRGTFYGTDAGNAQRIWLLAALETEKAHGIKEAKK
jgi:hypothetical protein